MIRPSFKPSSQMNKLQELSFQVVQHAFKQDVTNEYLSSVLVTGGPVICMKLMVSLLAMTTFIHVLTKNPSTHLPLKWLFLTK